MMGCLSDDEFGAMLDNELAADRREHLESCPTCAETWARVERAEWTVRTAPRRRSRTLPFIAAAAAALLIALLAWQLSRPTLQPPVTPAKDNTTANTAEPKKETSPKPEPEPKKPEVVKETPKQPAPEPKKPEEVVKQPEPKQPEPEPKKPEQPVVDKPAPKQPDPGPKPEPKKPEDPIGKPNPEPKKPEPEPKKPEPARTSPEVLAHMDEFDKFLRRAGRDEMAREAAVMALRQKTDPAIMVKLIDLYDNDTNPRWRAAVAGGLASYRTSDKALKALAGWLSHDGRQGDVDRTILESMAEFDGESLRDYAHKINGAMGSKDPYVARAAMNAAAVSRDLTNVDALLEQMIGCQREMRAYLGGGDEDGSLDSPAVQAVIDKHSRDPQKVNDARVQRYVSVMPALNGSLQKITGQKLSSHRQWKEYWEKARKSYKP